MVNKLKMRGETEYHVVSGVSIGSLNAHILAQNKIGEEDKAVE